MTDLRTLVEAVRTADKAFWAHRSQEHGDDSQLWTAKQNARRALRQALYETTGASIDELADFCRT